MNDSDLKQTIKDRYGDAATRVSAGTTGASCCGSSACCGSTTATWDPITAKLYDEQAQGLYVFLLNFTRNEADTRDLLQEVFTKLARQPEPSTNVQCRRRGRNLCGRCSLQRPRTHVG